MRGEDNAPETTERDSAQGASSGAPSDAPTIHQDAQFMNQPSLQEHQSNKPYLGKTYLLTASNSATREIIVGPLR